MNIVEPIFYQCRINPYATAIATPGAGMGSIKYGQLDALIHNVARAAIKAGLAPGDVAAIYVADPIVQAVLLLSFMRIGVVTMPLGAPRLPEHVLVTAIVTGNRQAFAGAGKVITVDASWLQGDGSALDYDRIYRCKPGDMCHIYLTSGSTGRQKGVAYSHQMMIETANPVLAPAIWLPFRLRIQFLRPRCSLRSRELARLRSRASTSRSNR